MSPLLKKLKHMQMGVDALIWRSSSTVMKLVTNFNLAMCDDDKGKG